MRCESIPLCVQKYRLPWKHSTCRFVSETTHSNRLIDHHVREHTELEFLVHIAQKLAKRRQPLEPDPWHWGRLCWCCVVQGCSLAAQERRELLALLWLLVIHPLRCGNWKKKQCYRRVIYSEDAILSSTFCHSMTTGSFEEQRTSLVRDLS